MIHLADLRNVHLGHDGMEATLIEPCEGCEEQLLGQLANLLRISTIHDVLLIIFQRLKEGHSA